MVSLRGRTHNNRCASLSFIALGSKGLAILHPASSACLARRHGANRQRRCTTRCRNTTPCACTPDRLVPTELKVYFTSDFVPICESQTGFVCRHALAAHARVRRPALPGTRIHRARPLRRERSAQRLAAGRQGRCLPPPLSLLLCRPRLNDARSDEEAALMPPALRGRSRTSAGRPRR